MDDPAHTSALGRSGPNRTAGVGVCVDRDRGAVLAEYGLLIAVVFLSVATAVAIFHDELIAFFSAAAGTIANEGS